MNFKRPVLLTATTIFLIVCLVSLSFSAISDDKKRDIPKEEIVEKIITPIADLDQLNEVKPVQEVRNNGEIAYKVNKDLKIIGFEPVLVNKTMTYQDCSNITELKQGLSETLDENAQQNQDEKIEITADDISPNVTTVCTDVTKVYQEYDFNDKSVPIYEISTPKGLEIAGKQINFTEKGCWVCGKYMACLSKKDGYADNRADIFKCDANNYPIIRSGESGWIQDTTTNQIIANRSDVGVVR